MSIKRSIPVVIIILTVFSTIVYGQATRNNIVVTEAKALITDFRFYRDAEGNVPVDIKSTVAVVTFSDGLATIRLDGVPEGTYRRMSFKINPEGELLTSDPDFSAAGNERYSIIVKGYYNTYPFTYKTDVTSNKTVIYSQPYIVGETGDRSVIITVEGDPKIWFTGNDGSILNPNDGMNRSKIDQNIQTSFSTRLKQFDKNIQR